MWSKRKNVWHLHSLPPRTPWLVVLRFFGTQAVRQGSQGEGGGSIHPPACMYLLYLLLTSWRIMTPLDEGARSRGALEGRSIQARIVGLKLLPFFSCVAAAGATSYSWGNAAILCRLRFDELGTGRWAWYPWSSTGSITITSNKKRSTVSEEEGWRGEEGEERGDGTQLEAA